MSAVPDQGADVVSPDGDEAFDCLSSISLDALNSSAELLTRVDRKYIVSHDLLDSLIREWRDDLSVLQIDERRVFQYMSTYFDTADLALHRAAATHRRRRFKVRTRTYDDTGLTMLEVKTKDGRGRTVKHRVEHDRRRADELTAGGARFVEQVTGAGHVVDLLRPSLTTRYRRATLVDLAASSRCTVDRELVCAAPDGRTVELNAVIVETKSGPTPSGVDRWMWQQGIRPTKVSKYSTALAVLYPDLPDNSWHRTIARHFRLGD